MFLSVIYTYRINREVSEPKNHWGMKQPTTLIDPEHELEGKINGLIGQLEQLIGDLRKQEAELTEIVDKAQRWDVQLSDTAFADILQQQILTERVPLGTVETETLEAKVRKDGKREAASPIQEAAILPKYEQIIQLSREGLTVSQIAEKLNLGQREVDLVIKMKSQEADTDV